MAVPGLQSRAMVPLTRQGIAKRRRALEQHVVNLQRGRGRESLREYIKMAWNQVEPLTPFLSNWHIDAISDHLQAVTEGHIQNLIINIPPRHGKSLSVSVFWPTWEWIDKPQMRYLFFSYQADNTIRDNIWSRELIQSHWYQQRWGYAYQLSRAVNRRDRVETDSHGYRIAGSVNSGITGEGGQRIVVDDPHELDDDESPWKVRDVAHWWDTVIPTRVNEPKTASRVIVQQRIHDKDLTGHLLEQMADGGRHYEKLVLPAEYEKKSMVSFERTSKKTGEIWRPRVEIGNLPPEIRPANEDPKKLIELPRDPRREDGELLWPERMPRGELESLKKELKRKASGQLQQRPVPSEGDVFKERIFRYWRYASPTDDSHAILHLDHEDRIVPLEGTVFNTVDLATSLSETANETVISTWIWTESKHLLWLWCEHGHMEGPDIIPAIKRQMTLWGSQIVGIERTGMQLAFVQEARRDGMPVVGLRPDRDKRTRAIPAVVMMDGQQLLIAGSAPWRQYAEAQMLKFTGGPNDEDDIVDTLSYASWIVLNMLESKKTQRERTWGRGAR